MICLVAFVVGGIRGICKGAKVTGTWALVAGTIVAIIAVVTYLSANRYYNRKFSVNDLLWRAITGFANGLTLKINTSTTREIIKTVLIAIGLGGYIFFINWFY